MDKKQFKLMIGATSYLYDKILESKGHHPDDLRDQYEYYVRKSLTKPAIYTKIIFSNYNEFMQQQIINEIKKLIKDNSLGVIYNVSTDEDYSWDEFEYSLILARLDLMGQIKFDLYEIKVYDPYESTLNKKQCSHNYCETKYVANLNPLKPGKPKFAIKKLTETKSLFTFLLKFMILVPLFGEHFGYETLIKNIN